MPNAINVVRGQKKKPIWPRHDQGSQKQVVKVRENLKAAQSRQNSYVDTRRRSLEFQPGDFAYLKVSPIRGT